MTVENFKEKNEKLLNEYFEKTKDKKILEPIPKDLGLL